MKSKLSEIRNIRLEKAQKLREMGIDPYPSKSTKEYSNKEIVDNFEKFDGKEVTLAGRLMSWREHGQIAFGHIQDESGKMQLFVQEKELQKTDIKSQTLGWKDLNLLDVGDFVETTGLIGKTTRGEISLIPHTIRILTKSLRPLPDKWEGLTDPELIYRKRYLDLVMNPDRKEMFKRKARFWQANREFMFKNGFIEVETPILEHLTGGADARPFETHHHALDEDFYLRISTELYQKRLIGGGFEKVFTLGPNFRNEGIDDEHLQEYYQIEWYWAYANYRQNMDLVRDSFRYVAKEVYGKTKFESKGHTFDLADDWEEIDYVKVIKDTHNIDIFKATDNEMLAVIKKHGVELSGTINRIRLIDNLWKIIRKGIAGPAFLVHVPKIVSPLAKSLPGDDARTERFQPIIAGTELGNGYSELNEPVDQYERFLEQQSARDAGDDEAQMMDIDYVEMLEYGMPPTSGYAHSERAFWAFENVSAREATFFPQLRFKVDDSVKEIYPEFKIPRKSSKK
jgi:lysyl-tRNA synthetase, class II